MTTGRVGLVGAAATRWLVRWSCRVLPSGGGPGWPEAMRAEIETIPSARARFGFALGCLLAAVRERARVRATSIAVRMVGMGLAGVFVLQGVIESRQWLNGNDSSRRFYLFVIAVIVALLTATTLRLTARRARLAGVTLVAGAAGGLAAGTLWAAITSFSPFMPRDAAGSLVLIAGFAAIAAGSVGYRTRTLRDVWAAGTAAAAVGTALVFSISELTIQEFPGRIPDIVGPVMPAGSTAEQVLRENRIEIVDGYVGLLFVLVALLAGLILVCWAPRHPDGLQHAVRPQVPVS